MLYALEAKDRKHAGVNIDVLKEQGAWCGEKPEQNADDASLNPALHC